MRQAAFAGAGARSIAIPLEPFSTNKEMGRILIRRGGETIAAGECALHSPFIEADRHTGIVLEIIR